MGKYIYGLLMTVFVFCDCFAEITVEDVRSDIEACISSLSGSTTEPEDSILEFGIRYRSPNNYNKLVQDVSNNFSYVMSRFDMCATNGIQRLILLSVGWSAGDENYLNCLSNAVELAVLGKISKKELRWYQEGSKRYEHFFALANNYDKPGVSNLVLRLQQCIGETNRCQKILSGEAQREAEEYMRVFVE